jgi:hypothetical protein
VPHLLSGDTVEDKRPVVADGQTYTPAITRATSWSERAQQEAHRKPVHANP